MSETFLNGRIVLHAGDSRDVLKTIPDCSVDAIVCDPPYALTSTTKRWANTERTESTMPKVAVYARATQGFMGQKWDTGETAFDPTFWAECLRVLRPGGHVVAFSGTRTYHRMACAIEDAGFEIRDMLSWLYGSGFPKSHDVSKGIDKANGDERPVVSSRKAHDIRGGNLMEASQGKGVGAYTIDITSAASAASAAWDGWGTALKPACEPICFGRKPMRGTVAANVLEHGTGAINIDGCRVGFEDTPNPATNPLYRKQNGYALHTGDDSNSTSWKIKSDRREQPAHSQGRWPANIIHDGSEEVLAAFPDAPGQQQDIALDAPSARTGNVYGKMNRHGEKSADSRYADRGSTNFAALPGMRRGDTGSAARFFYTAKADADDRLGSKHPTVKPVDLMQWLCRLVTPKGGIVLDPFAGTGTTGEAAFREGFNAVLIEREAEYQADIRRRMALCMAGPDERARESIKAKTKDQPVDHGPLFAGAAE